MKLALTALLATTLARTTLATDFWVGYADSGSAGVYTILNGPDGPTCSNKGSPSIQRGNGNVWVSFSMCGHNIDMYNPNTGNLDFYLQGGDGKLAGTRYGYPKHATTCSNCFVNGQACQLWGAYNCLYSGKVPRFC